MWFEKDELFLQKVLYMLHNITSEQLFQILKERVGEKEAEALIEFVDVKIKETNDVNLKTLATKEDIVRTEGKLETKIEVAKNETVKWLFGFFIAISLMILTLFFRK